jgi:hypothetical protein
MELEKVDEDFVFTHRHHFLFLRNPPPMGTVDKRWRGGGIFD